MANRLEGEVALVTGSTSGIGAEVARLFAAEGAAVVVTGRNHDRGEAVAAEIERSGGAAHFSPAELADADDCGRLVSAAVERFASLTVLVNNAVASDGGDGTVTEIEPAQWEHILRVNLTAAAWLCRHAIPVMAAAGHGSIVNISSRAAERGTPGHAAYSASKAGLNALTRNIAVDHARQGIRANTVSPGYILNERRDANLDDARRRRLEVMHLTRLGQPSDVAYAALYLASREAEFVTGINLPVDGGSSTARASTLG